MMDGQHQMGCISQGLIKYVWPKCNEFALGSSKLNSWVAEMKILSEVKKGELLKWGL